LANILPLIPLKRIVTAYIMFGPLLTTAKLYLVFVDERTVGLVDLPDLAAKMLKGDIRSKHVVDLNNRKVVKNLLLASQN
jgi:hypothetical protein